MNPILTDYQRHIAEAHKSANEAIKHLNEFGKHFSQLSDNDKRELFQIIITEQALPDNVRNTLNYMFFGIQN